MSLGRRVAEGLWSVHRFVYRSSGGRLGASLGRAGYERYDDAARREMPVVILEPTNGEAG